MYWLHTPQQLFLFFPQLLQNNFIRFELMLCSWLCFSIRFDFVFHINELLSLGKSNYVKVATYFLVVVFLLIINLKISQFFHILFLCMLNCNFPFHTLFPNWKPNILASNRIRWIYVIMRIYHVCVRDSYHLILLYHLYNSL